MLEWLDERAWIGSRLSAYGKCRVKVLWWSRGLPGEWEDAMFAVRFLTTFLALAWVCQRSLGEEGTVKRLARERLPSSLLAASGGWAENAEAVARTQRMLGESQGKQSLKQGRAKPPRDVSTANRESPSAPSPPSLASSRETAQGRSLWSSPVQWLYALGVLGVGLVLVTARFIWRTLVDRANDRLYKAIREGDIETVRSMTRNGFGLNGDSKSGWTPLHLAAKLGQHEIAKVLLANGADCSARHKLSKDTVLHQAADSGQLSILHLLAAQGVDLSPSDNRGQTPLDRAVARSDSACAAFLLSRGARFGGRIPLPAAVKTGNRSLLRMLINNGGAARLNEYRDPSLVEMAVARGATDVLALLLECGADPHLGQPLLAAAEINASVLVELLLQHGANAKKDEALCVAAERGNVAIGKLLLAAGADPALGRKPLRIAVERRHDAFLEVLFAHGVEVAKVWDVSAQHTLCRDLAMSGSRRTLWLVGKNAGISESRLEHLWDEAQAERARLEEAERERRAQRARLEQAEQEQRARAQYQPATGETLQERGERIRREHRALAYPVMDRAKAAELARKDKIKLNTDIEMGRR